MVGMVMRKGGAPKGSNGKGKPPATSGKANKGKATAKALGAKTKMATPTPPPGGMPMVPNAAPPPSQMPNAKTIQAMKTSIGKMA